MLPSLPKSIPTGFRLRKIDVKKYMVIFLNDRYVYHKNRKDLQEHNQTYYDLSLRDKTRNIKNETTFGENTSKHITKNAII